MNNNPMHDDALKKCHALTRRHTLCQTAAVKGKKQCRMHGGAKGSGAPKGNNNAFKHGYYSANAIKIKQKIRKLLKESIEFLEKII
ncbi:MAG: hypothetical protein JNK42_00090 [Caedimonas sp.]|nr:hypothetical protein [Caedimonas sp.]